MFMPRGVTIIPLRHILGDQGRRYRLLLLIVGILIGTGQALGNHWERVRHMFGDTGTAFVQTFDPFKCLGCIVTGRLIDSNNSHQSKTELILYLAVAMAVSQLIFAISSVDEGWRTTSPFMMALRVPLVLCAFSLIQASITSFSRCLRIMHRS